jgi:two-component system, repressor protein LuxO
MSLTADAQAITVLVADPDPSFRRVLSERASAVPGPLNFIEVDRIEGAESGAAVDVILLDLSGSVDVAATVTEAARIAPVIALSMSGSFSEAVAAMRAGAVDVLVKPLSMTALHESLGRILLLRSGKADDRPLISGFVGGSAPMRQVQVQIERIASSRAPVFITGESGTGKELTAETVHAKSGRTGRFVAINCAAIPGELMESEVFGHVRGAFTGAHETRIGAAELSHGGTLFLDEICEMDPGLQTKLLRFVQSGALSRVGETRLRDVDVRIVCATNRMPQDEVAAGRFREDLFYRLHVLPIHLPPLRDRPDDILPLARAFLSQFAAEEGRAFTGFAPASERLLANYDWPGNVRQLQNVIRRAVVLHDGPALLPEMLAMALAHAGAPVQPGHIADRPGTALEPFHLQERRIIERALDACGGHVARAAAALQISPSTIYRKMQGWEATTSAA